MSTDGDGSDGDQRSTTGEARKTAGGPRERIGYSPDPLSGMGTDDEGKDDDDGRTRS